MSTRTRLAPGIPKWNSLGLADPQELLAGSALPRGSQQIEAGVGVERWRVPMPGTIHDDGRRNGKPLGIGTGWLRVTLWTHPALGDLLRARFTKPASISLAERAWNLHCALRAAGVPTAEPLAVASESSAVVARRSILVTRELEGMLPLAEWIERFHAPRDRRLLSRALGLFIQRLAASGVKPATLHFNAIVAHEKSGGRSDCAIEQIRDIQDRTLVGGLAVSPLPELALAELSNGKQTAAPDPDAGLQILRLLAASIAAQAVRPRSVEVMRCIRAALGDRAGRAERHATAREMLASSLTEVRRHA